MHKIITTFILLTALSFTLCAQTPDEEIEKAVRIYNAMRDFEDSLGPKTVTDKDVDRLRADIARATPLLNNAIASGNAEQKTVATYFKANLQYELGFVYGMMGKNAEAYEVLKGIESDYENFSTSSKFPMQYKFDEKNYSIKWNNFSPTLSEYYTGMGEICVNLNKFDEALVWSRKSLNSSSSTDWYKYIACNKIIEVKKKKKLYDQEMMEVASKMIVIVTGLDSSYQSTIKEYNYPTKKSGYQVLTTIADDGIQLTDMAKHYSLAAEAMYNTESYNEAAFLYSFAQDKGYYKESSVEKIVVTAVKVNNYQLGLKAVDKYRANIIADNCGEYRKAIKWYGDLTDFKSADELRAELTKCEKRERRERNTSPVSSMNSKVSKFHFYLGFNPIGIMNVPARMNFGGDMAFLIDKFCIDFEFNRVQQDLDWPMRIKQEKYRWDGYAGYIGLKGVSKVNRRVSISAGPQFGFVWKQFSPVNTGVTDLTLGGVVNKTFRPQERQYRMLLVFDSYTWLSYFGIHIYAGLGLSVNQFDGGGAEYNNDNYQLSEKILNTRKPLYVAPQFKLGLSFGLHIPGKKE